MTSRFCYRVLGLAFCTAASFVQSEAWGQFSDPLDSNDPWPTFMQNFRNNGKSQSLGLTQPQLRWRQELPASSASQESAPLVVWSNSTGVPERLVVTTTNRSVHAFEATTGELLWRYDLPIGQDYRTSGKNTVANLYMDTQGTTVKSLIVPTTDGLFALSLDPTQPLTEDRIRTDNPLWSVDGFFSGGAAVLNLNNIDGNGQHKSLVAAMTSGDNLLATQGGQIMAVDGASGSHDWTYDLPVAENIGRSQPAVGATADGNQVQVYFTNWDADGSGNGRHLLGFKLDSNGVLLSDSGAVLSSPSPAWTANISQTPDQFESPPVQTFNNFVIRRGSLASPTLGDGNTGSVAPTDRSIYIPSDNGLLYSFDRDGTRNGSASTPELLADDIYYDSFDLNGVEYWTGSFFSTTAGLERIADENLLHVPREQAGQGQEHFTHQLGTDIELDSEYGESGIFGGVAVDADGSTFFLGKSHSQSGSAEADLSAVAGTLAGATGGSGFINRGHVNPIDVDGSTYILTQETVGNVTRYFLNGIRHMAGDMNGDGVVDSTDINPFVLALTDPTAYEQQFPAVNMLGAGDINNDGMFTNADINPFVALLSGGAISVPEPTAVSVALIAGALGLVAVRRGQADLR